MLKKILIILFLFTFGLVLISCQSKPDAYNIDGKPITFSDLKGKWLVINYWADWCKPCRNEIPELNKLYQQHKDQIIVLGVNYDHLPKDQLKHFASKFTIQYPLLITNPGEYFGFEHVNVVPSTYLIDPKGDLKQILLGPQNHAQLEKLMKL